MGRADLIYRTARRNCRSDRHGQLTTRFGSFPPLQLEGKHLGKLLWSQCAAILDIDYMRRKATQLVPRYDIGCRPGNNCALAWTRECLVCHVSKTHAMAITQKAGFAWN